MIAAGRRRSVATTRVAASDASGVTRRGFLNANHPAVGLADWA
jgi:hypothetical protein